MNKFLILAVVFIAACSDAGNTPEQSAKDTTPVTTETHAPSLPSGSRYDLTEQEASDDTVFDDGSKPSKWSVAAIDNVAGAKMFIKKLKYWVENNLKDSVANTIEYPTLGGIENKNQFLANYDSYINAKVKKAILNQNLRQIFRNVDGAMIGNGEIWFQETQGEFKIVAINNK